MRRGPKILVIQLRQLGDILLTTPVMAEIKRENPDAHVTFLSHAMGHLIIDGSPHVDEFFSYGSDWTLRREIGLARTLRSRNYDLVLDFMGNPRSALYALGTGSQQRWAFSSARRLTYTHVAPRAERSDYIVEEKFALMRAAGLKPDSAQAHRLILPWYEKHTAPLVKFIGTSAGWSVAPLRVCIAPTHRRVERAWPLERWAALADHLVADWNAFVIWLWGPGEESVADAVMAECRELTHKAPKTSFREMAALMANCDLFLGNSNGPSHVAVAVDTPSIQLHGPTLARSWCPLSQRHRAMAAAGILTRAPITAIAVDAMIAALEAMRPAIDENAEVRRKEGLRLAWS